MIDPDGQQIAEIDTGASPEVFSTTLAKAGTYTIVVTGFDGDTGDFTVDVRPVLARRGRRHGLQPAVLPAGRDVHRRVRRLNPLTGRPSELVGLAFDGDMQMAISRAGRGAPRARRLRTVLFDDATFGEWVDPQAPATFGHPTARGAIGVGAYDPFAPFLRETYTSPGDVQVFFDSRATASGVADAAAQPQVSAADRGNTTFFTVD